MNKLRTTAIGIGLALTLAGCGGGGGAKAADAVTGPTTTTVKVIAKKDLIDGGDAVCQKAGLTFGELRRQAADLMTSKADDAAATDFLVNTAIPQWEHIVGTFRVAGSPNRDGRDFDKLNKVLGDALTRMKQDAQNHPQDALADLAQGPDTPATPVAKAGDAFGNADDLASKFGFHDCSIF